MTVASFIAAQRTDHGVPHATCCRWLGVAPSSFYKWLDRPPMPTQQRRADLDAAVKASFDDSGGTPGTYGSPRVWEDLIEAGWSVSVNSVAKSMACQGLVGRSPERKRRSLTCPDAAPIPDLVGWDFTAERINQKWCGDLTEIPTDEGKRCTSPSSRTSSPGACPGRDRRAPRRRVGQGRILYGRCRPRR